ncbi:RHS repeat-associated core domain-containing protein [Pseudomonas sp. ChxA]|uniref:RHS repeat-associated core domain-containing protein n=1 Tax=Pseudomonas sp. ChxA TaxID=3035473 RepID=UPI002553C318|nr:RHS repeat-associated core domain-containing protein [Pseudomonas sp. ChxA]MDL2186598.1 RHS repeat-associated core domain-containing protein [Pseudomonas sp. ChxA]
MVGGVCGSHSKFRYDALGQLLSETCDAGELKYDYDALGNLQTLTLPDQRQLNHLYYGSGHLHQLNLNGRVICDFERDPLHDEVLRTQGSLLTRNRYDQCGRLSQKALHYRNAAREELPLLQKRYQYDASDNLIIERLTQTQRRGGSDPHQPLPDDGQLGRFLGQSHGKSVEGNEHYSYDATERLRDHRQSNLRNPELHRETYNYDAAANLLPTGRMGGYVKHNRVHVFEDKRYRYDRFGRLSEKRIGSHTVQRFRYDAEQRLICVEQDQGWQRLRSEYRYDPLGRRIGKRVYRNESEQPQSDVQFVWQGLRLLQEVEHGFGSVYVYANPDSYEPLARIDGRPGSEQIFYFHTNLAGLPEQLTDEAGLSVWHSEYEGWGKSRDEWHDQRVRREQNLRFQGQYLDRETGLHYNTFRFYDADVGRFTQPDPIGLMGGLNLYQYSPNPTGWLDPLGLSGCSGVNKKPTRGDNPYQTRFDPRTPGRPDPKFSIDTRTFTSGTKTSNGGIRNNREFWQQWRNLQPESLSKSNQYRINELGIAPKIDNIWIKNFPEHAKYKGDNLVHHHVNFGQYAIPVPSKTHVGSGGPWHAK